MLELEPFEALAISLASNKGVYTLLLGSGLSRAAGIPSGWEITLDLVRRLGELKGVKDVEDWAAWYAGRFGKSPSYSELLDGLASTPSERRAILHGYIEPGKDEELRRPTKAHKQIAQLVANGFVRVIVTTNFDRLIENALREVGVEPTIIAGEDSLSGAVPLAHSACTVIKLHGDYLDTRIKNTEDELAGYTPQLDRLLDRVFDEFGVIVAGWSGEWDLALRAALLRTPSRRYPLFWAARGSVPLLAQDIIDQRGGRVIPISDADTFLQRLSETADALARSSRPHPHSTAAALALAKKYCRDDAFAPEWAELLNVQAGRLRDYLGAPTFPIAQAPEASTIAPFLDELVGRTEILRRACLVSAHWGTTAANQTVLKVVRAAALNSVVNTSYVYWRALSDMPAVLTLFWAAAGALDRDDYTYIYHLLRMPIRRAYENQPVLSGHTLLMGTVSSGSTYVDWKVLGGPPNQLAPGSRWLAARFEPECADIAVSPEDAASLFDRTEFLLAAQFAYERLGKMKASEGLWFWTPPGRYMWSRETSFSSRLDELRSLDQHHPMLLAGFFGGSLVSAKATADAMQDFASKNFVSFSI